MSAALAAPVHDSLALLSQARAALDKAQTVQEVKGLRDQAEALRVYLAQQVGAEGLTQAAAEMKLRAERKAGAMLAAAKASGERAKGGRRAKPGHDAGVEPPTLAELGIEPSAAKRWQQEAAVPERAFEAHVEAVKLAGETLTQAGVIALSRPPRIKLKKKGPSKPAALPAPTTYDATAGVAALTAAPWLELDGILVKLHNALKFHGIARGVEVYADTVDRLVAAADPDAGELAARMKVLGRFATVAEQAARKLAHVAVPA